MSTTNPHDIIDELDRAREDHARSSGGPSEEERASSWAPIDFRAAAMRSPSPPTIIACVDGQGGLLYRAKRHLISGEPESHKTWLANVAAVDAMREGDCVVWFDFDGMGAAELDERLVALGATGPGVDRHLEYLAPDEQLDDLGRLELERLISVRRPALVVVDAVGPAMELLGLDSNSERDVQRFFRDVVEPFHRAGAATLALDHVVKNAENRGRYSIGNQRKLAAVDVHLGLSVDGEPMSRSHPWVRINLRAHKDRPGYFKRGPGRRIGTLGINLDLLPAWRFELAAPAEERGVPAVFRPTNLMEKVSIYLEGRLEAVTLNAIKGGVPGNAAAKATAVDRLMVEGYVGVEQRGAQARLHRSVRPYRQATDPAYNWGSDG